MSIIIDCHAHLASSRFEGDRDEVLERARASGVGVVVVVGEDREDNERVRRVVAAQSDDGPCRMLPCFGFHPDRFADDAEPPDRAELDRTFQQIREGQELIVAIGEVGLDFYYAKSEARREAQKRVLEEIAALSHELDLPLNVHSRSAGHYTVDLLIAAGAKSVLMHAFDGKVSHAKRGAEHGFLFSIPPSAVRSEQKQKMIQKLPLESLALESDAPVLGPVRTERNEPKNLRLTAELMAKAHGVSLERIEELTTANAKRIFRKIDL